MIIRYHLKWSVKALCILAIVSFFMIFVISLTLIANLNDKIKLYSPLTMSNTTSWASIPGTLNYTYSKQLYLFNIVNLTDDKEINMTHVGPFNYTIERQFTDLVYDDVNRVVNYTMNHNYSLSEDSSPDLELTNIQMLNLDGEAIWYQMNSNRPEFFKAW